MRKIRAIFLFTCCLLVAVGPLNLMQMLAWGNMLHDYSGERSMTEAAEMTFSGDYPCEMCRRIAETRAEQATEPSPEPLKNEERNSLRLDFHCHEDRDAPDLDWVAATSLSPGECAFAAPLPRFHRVPTPPPQALSC